MNANLQPVCWCLERARMRRPTNAELYCTVHKASDLCRAYIKLHTSILYARLRACRGWNVVMSNYILVSFRGVNKLWKTVPQPRPVLTYMSRSLHICIPLGVEWSQNLINGPKKFQCSNSPRSPHRCSQDFCCGCILLLPQILTTFLFFYFLVVIVLTMQNTL